MQTRSFSTLARRSAAAFARCCLGGLAALVSGCASCEPPALGDSGPPSGIVLVNELLALNGSGLADESGQRDDWLELYNPSQGPVDLAGFGLSDDPAAPGKMKLPPGTLLAPGAFLLVWTDDDPEQGPLHAPFRLSGDGESVVLTDAEGGLVDEISFGVQATDVSIGRSPDGEGDVVALVSPTPGEANTPPRDLPDGGVVDAGPPPLAPVINEVQGAPSSFVELYNPHDEAVALAGLYLSPNPVAPLRWAIPDGAPALAPGGFAVFLTDGDTGAGPEHASFAFNDPGTLVLSTSSAVVLEQVSVPALPDDVSWARLPDGSGGFSRGAPTEGSGNVALSVDAGQGGRDSGPGAGALDGGGDAG